MTATSIDELCINTVRFLAVDAVEKATTGPLGQGFANGVRIAIGLSRFGASAPGEVIYQKLGLDARHVTDEAQKLLRRKS